MKNGSITFAFDVEEKLRKSFGKIIQSMLEEEMNEHLGREKYEYEKTEENNKLSDNYRNGHSKKKVKSNFGEVELNYMEWEILQEKYQILLRNSMVLEYLQKW